MAQAPTVLAALCIVGVQYTTRKTQWSRAVLAAAIVASAFLMPRPGVALASNQIVNPPGFDLNQIRIAFDETHACAHYDANLGAAKGTCFSLAVKVEGLPQGTVLRAFGETSGEVTSSLAARARS